MLNKIFLTFLTEIKDFFMSSSLQFGDYNHGQRISFQSIRKACKKLTSSQIQQLRESFQSYLQFRREMEAFQLYYFGSHCQKTCFETGLSACCGFESIVTFFADQVINLLMTSEENILSLLQVLERPNTTGKCVYLGEHGCLWQVRPISCAMFLCDPAKKIIFERYPEAESVWKHFQEQEKEYNWPTKPVLFDDLENYFLELGVESPHLYFHQSPGLLRVKKKAGLTI